QPGGGSVGVMLRTTDGGLKWEEVGLNVLPGLHLVRFFDDKNGYVGGDGSDAFPSGLFTTTDGGRTWRPVGGPRVPSWRAADCQFADTVIVAGAWSRLGRFGQGSYTDAELDPLSGRTLHAVAVAQSPKSVAAHKGFAPVYAAGDGGAVLTSTDGGKRWGSVNLGLSPATLASCDFRCVAARGSHVWVAGRPGSFVLHSPDAG